MDKTTEDCIEKARQKISAMRRALKSVESNIDDNGELHLDKNMTLVLIRFFEANIEHNVDQDKIFFEMVGARGRD